MAKGKKSGAFLNQKKKAGSADFSNPKAKVGRKVKRRVGETDASFQTRQLSIGEQSIARQKKDGAKTSKRGLTCEEHLGQLGHHNDKARAAAAEGLADICAAHADEAWRLFGPLLDGAARLLGDAHRPCRRHALRLLQAGLVPAVARDAPGNAALDDAQASTRRAAVRAAAPLLAARLGAALSSFDGGCRADAAEALESFLVDHGDDDLRRAVAANLLGPLLTPLANAARVAPAPRDHEAGKSAYRPTLLRVVAALFLADAPARKRGRRFSFAPEDDVLDVDDVAEGDDAIPGHRGVVLLRDVRRARPGDWRRREAAAAAAATVADGEAAARVEDAASARRELAGRVAELAADAVRRAEAAGATTAAASLALEELEPLCCLARRRPDLFGATRDVLATAAPLRLGDRAASQLARGVAERADAALLSCAVDAGLAGEAVGPALELLKKHQAGGRGVVRRLLLAGVSGDARRRLLAAAGVDGGRDPQLLADLAAAAARDLAPGVDRGDDAALAGWAGSLAALVGAGGAKDGRALRAVVDAVRRSPAHSAVPAAVARHLVGVVASPSSWPAAGALLYHLPLPLGDDVVDAAAAAAAATPAAARALLDALTARAARDEDGGAGACLARGAAALLERSAAAPRDGDAAAAAFLAARDAAASVAEADAGPLVAALATMVDGALARPGGDDAAARRSRQARVEYLCVSLCRALPEASLDDALAARVAVLALRRLAAAERSAGEGLGPAAAAAAGLLRDRPRVRARAYAAVDAAVAGAVGDATPLPKCAALALAYALRDASLRADGALAALARRAKDGLLRGGDLELRDAALRVEALLA